MKSESERASDELASCTAAALSTWSRNKARWAQSWGRCRVFLMLQFHIWHLCGPPSFNPPCCFIFWSLLMSRHVIRITSKSRLSSCHNICYSSNLFSCSTFKHQADSWEAAHLLLCFLTFFSLFMASTVHTHLKLMTQKSLGATVAAQISSKTGHGDNLSLHKGCMSMSCFITLIIYMLPLLVHERWDLLSSSNVDREIKWFMISKYTVLTAHFKLWWA